MPSSNHEIPRVHTLRPVGDGHFETVLVTAHREYLRAMGDGRTEAVE
jgi:hypothetical protein